MASADIIYGTHTVQHALEQSINNVTEIWVQDNKQTAKPLTKIIQLSNTAALAVQYVPKQTLDKLVDHARHQGVVIRCKSAPSAKIDLDSLLTLDDGSLALYLVLDGIQDPHNLGACLRTADAAGVRAVIIPKDRAVGLNATVRMVASGAAENIPLIQVTNLARSLREMQEAGVWIIGTADDADASLYDIDLKRPLAFIMGAEEKGLRQNTRKHCDELVRVPMTGIVGSLNVSVATGVCLFEVCRQRGGGS